MFLLLVCIVGIFLISSVSATNLNETDVTSENDDAVCDEVVCSDGGDDVLSYEGSQNLSAVDEDYSLQDSPYNPYNPGPYTPPDPYFTYPIAYPKNNTFAAIQEACNSNSMVHVILDGTYVMQPDDNPITLSSINVLIEGRNGATIDGNGIGRLFNVDIRCVSLSFNNIIFKNAVSNTGPVASGSVSKNQITGEIIVIHTTSFENCTFINNSATKSGGAIYYCKANNCIFINNSAVYGGAMQGSSATNCIFINNSAVYGGAMNEGTVTNCNLTGNSASDGGAIYNSKAINSIFTDNSAVNGGAVFTEKNNFVIDDCLFENNFASDNGGAVYIKKSNNGVINNSCFDSCFATNEGNVAYWAEGSGLTICLSSFENCVRRGGSSYLKFSSGISDYDVYDCIFDVPPSDIIYYYTSRLSVGTLKVFEGEKGVLTASLSNIFGPISDKEVNFRVGDDIYSVVSDSEGNVEFNFTDYYSEVNEYNVIVSFDGYDNVHPISKNTSVLIVPINKFTSVLNVFDLSAYKGEGACLVVNLSDSRGPLANKIIKMIINSNVQEFFTDSEGLVSINADNYFSYGKSTVSFNFEGDDFDKFSSKEINVTMNRYDPIFNVGDLSVEYNSTEFLIVNLSDFRGQLSNKALNFNISGNKYKLSTDSQGIVKLRVRDYITDPGEYVINITFDGDDSVSPGSKEVCIFYKYIPILECNDLSIVKGEDGKLSVVLSNAAGLLSGNTVIFNVGGNNKPLLTSSGGVASLKVTDYFNDFGTYTIGVSFNGDEVNFPVSKNITVSINEYKGNLTVNQIGKYYDDAFLMFNLINSRTSEGVFNASIQVRFSTGETVILTTDLDGLANYSLSFAPNNYSLEAKIINPNVDVNNVTYNFEIKELRGIIEITQNGTDYNHTDLIVKLSNDEDVFRNIQINILFEDTGDSEVLTTDDNGIAVCPVPFIPGSYHVLAYVSGDYTYFSPVNEDIVIGKSDAEVIFSSDEILFEYNKTGHMNLTVVGGIVDEVSVVGYSNAAILNGNMVSVSGLKIGHYILNVTVNPDSYHNRVSKTINISVVKAASSVSGDDIVFDYQNSGFTTLNVVGGSVDSVCVVGYPDANVTLNGNVVTVLGLNAGNYTLQVITAPDSNHNSIIDENIKIIVNKIDSSVSSENIVFDWGTYGNATLNVIGGSVGSVCVVGYPEIKPALSGNNVIISTLNAGNYTLQVITAPDDNHNSIIDENIKIIVNKVDSSIICEDIVFDYGGSGVGDVSVVGGSVGSVSVVGYPEIKPTLSGNRVTVFGLGAGNYKLQVITNPDDSHFSVTGFINITVNKVASAVSGGDIVFDYNGFGNTTLTVAGGSIDSVGVVGHPEVKPVLLGNVVTVSGLNAGTYKLQIITSPDSNHTSIINKDIKITVNKIDSGVSGDDIVFDYNGFGNTTLTVIGSSVSDVSIVGHPEVKPVLSGNVVTVSGLNVGKYTLQVITSSNINYNSITDENIMITVNKIDSDVSGNDIVFNYGGSGSTTLNVVGSSVSSVSVMGYPEVKPSLDGNVVSVSGLNAGKYKLKVITTSNQNYNSVVRFINIIVNRINADFNFGTKGISFESDSYGYVEIKDIVGGRIVLSNISVVGYSDAVISYDDDSRVITVSNLEANTYYLSVTIIPDANHNPVTKTNRMIVTKSSSNNPTLLPSTVRISPVVSYYGTSVSATITNLNGGTVKQANISVEGHPEITPKLAGSKITVSGLKVGTYNLVVTTTPDEMHYSVTETVSITVKKIPALLKASAWSDYPKSKKVWKIKLTNSKTKKPLANMQIVLKVYKGGKLEKTLKRTTNSKGEVSLKPSSWKVGKHTVKISFSKTGYSCNAISKTVKVLKPTKLKYKFVIDYLDDGATLHIYVKAGKKPVNNVKLKLKVPKRKKPISFTTGKYYNKKKKRTDVGYVAYGTNMLPSGTYTFKIEPASLKYTGSKSKTITIKVKKGANKNVKSETIVSKGKRQQLYK